MKCFYHSADLDGHCSGAIVKLKYSQCELYPIDYGNSFPWNQIEKEDIIVMTDFSLQPFENMIKLNDQCKELIWIDHHKSAIEEARKNNFECCGIQEIGIGAAQLTWEYFMGSSIPKAVRLIAEYDVWNHSNPNTLPFHFGLRLYDTDPSVSGGMSIWYRLFSGEVFIIQHIIEKGKTVLELLLSKPRVF